LAASNVGRVPLLSRVTPADAMAASPSGIESPTMIPQFLLSLKSLKAVAKAVML